MAQRDSHHPAHDRRRPLLLGLLAVVLTTALPVIGVAHRQTGDDSDDEAIRYTQTPANDAITRLQKQIDTGSVKLEYEPSHGYLRSVLRKLGISPTSQMLVFSKTSFQRELIGPTTPRALYFNDSAYIGWVQGAPVLEVASVDPQLGAVFYVLEQRPAARPRFVRQSYECLQCHSGSMTRGVPGHIMRSVYARADGLPDFRAGTFLTTDQSPLWERWGGWYVSGYCGQMRHMGNVIARGSEEDPTLDRDRGANVSNLSGFFNTSAYLTHQSDIVALMVAEHQEHIQNLITRANYQTRIALRYELGLNRALGRPDDFRADSTVGRVRSACEPLLKAMLFCEEAALTSTATGTSGFAEQFQAAGPRDHKQRSLRQLDLKTHLMRYRCSYMIYSDAFNGLPKLARETFYSMLWAVLDGKAEGEAYSHLSKEERAAIREILLETKPDFAAARPH